MKKIIAGVLILILSFTVFTSCSSNKNKVIAEAPEKPLSAFENAKGETVYPIGNTVKINDWEITFKKISSGREIWAQNNYIYYPADDCSFIFYSFSVTNNAKEDRIMLSDTAYTAMTATMYVEDQPDINFTAEKIFDVPTNAYVQSIAAGETKDMAFTFQVPNEVASQDLVWHMRIESKDLVGNSSEKIIFSFD